MPPAGAQPDIRAVTCLDDLGDVLPRGAGTAVTEREKVSRVTDLAIDFTTWGLDAEWPVLRWAEPVSGGSGRPARALRLGHADDTAMVLTCTYPRPAFDGEARACGLDPLAEIAFETTYTQANLALHQVTAPARRPGGLVEALVSHARAQAAGYQDWAAVQWGERAARMTQLASWQSGFAAVDASAYVVVHACGMAMDLVQLRPAQLSGYAVSRDLAQAGSMRWELWPARPELAYDELVSAVSGR